MRPLDAEQIERLTADLSQAGLDRTLAELVPDRPWAGLAIAVIEDGPQPAEEVEPIPQEDVDGKLDAFLDCVREDFGYFALVLALTILGVILAIVGVFVPPVEITAATLIATFGAEVAAFVMHCLIKAGFFGG